MKERYIFVVQALGTQVTIVILGTGRRPFTEDE